MKNDTKSAKFVQNLENFRFLVDISQFLNFLKVIYRLVFTFKVLGCATFVQIELTDSELLQKTQKTFISNCEIIIYQ